MFQITRNGQTITTIPADSARAVFTIYASATKRGDTLRLVDDSGRTIETHQGERALSFHATRRSRATVATQPSLF